MHYPGTYRFNTFLPRDVNHDKKKILVIDDDEIARVLITGILESTAHYTVIAEEKGSQGIKLASQERPDLIILDVMMPAIDGFEVCKILRADITTRFIPVIILSAKGEVSDRIEGLVIGADDYITKPFNHDELIARVDTLLRRNELSLDANPLTRLPGNISIERELTKRITEKKRFAIGYIDLDNFKAYNDRYGFALGDRVIFDTGHIIKSVLQQSDFLGHIGGDDFVFITTPDRVDKICRKIIKTFDSEIPQYYDEQSRTRGYIQSKSRKGKVTRFKIMTISIAVVTNVDRSFSHFAEIGEVGAELKKYLKTLKGSNYIIDRRKGNNSGVRARGREKTPDA